MRLDWAAHSFIRSQHVVAKLKFVCRFIAMPLLLLHLLDLVLISSVLVILALIVCYSEFYECTSYKFTSR